MAAATKGEAKMTESTSGTKSQEAAGHSGQLRPELPGRNIVLCSDGTGNRGGKARGTNVWEIVNAVWRQPNAEGKLPKRTQVTFYDDGVGSQNFIAFKILGGAFGWGYSRNIRDLYRSLVSAYEPGDDIYLFGFSRGAYTVRGLAGMILKQGILNRHKFETSKELDYAVMAVFRAYRDSYKSVAGWLWRRLRPGYARKYQSLLEQGKIHELDNDKKPQSHIRFIGVWDTVDAVGLPVDEMADLLDLVVRFRFRDQDLHENVEKACHAMSLDDERGTFWPVMWNEDGARESSRITQVWFSGMHSNVGGGYEKDQMAFVSLDWMMQEAEKAGLQFYRDVRDRIREDANAHGKMYDSRAGLAAYYRYRPRSICAIGHDDKAGVCIDEPKVHFSALRRAARATADYAPISLAKKIKVVSTHEADGQLAENLATRYEKTAAGRAAQAEKIRQLVRGRIALYYLFLAYTLGLAAAAIWFYLRPGTPVADPAMPDPVGLLFKIIEMLLPGFVLHFVDPLLAQAKAHWILFLLAIAILACFVIVKHLLENRSRQAALDAWRDFREKAH